VADEASRTYAGIDLSEHVVRILGRRAAYASSAGDRAAIEALARDVLAALRAEFTDHNGAYHAFEPEPFPTMRELSRAIGEDVRSLTIQRY
jgi:hypothetical protein